MNDDLRQLLDDVAAGRRPVDEALHALETLGISAVGDYARLDIGRAARKGVPEIVFAAGKTSDQLAAIVARFLERSNAVVGSRVSAEQAEAVRMAVNGVVEYDARARMVVVHGLAYESPPKRGAVGILAGGTSDVAVAEEAAIVCREMGVAVSTAYDVGVAGVHRLGGPLAGMIEDGVGALVVAAGMEGALPSVVGGLVDVPVIGLPVSTGYGFGGNGEAALMGMLQSCSPGLAVVNIDNGVGAGVTAALIARRGAT